MIKEAGAIVWLFFAFAGPAMASTLSGTTGNGSTGGSGNDGGTSANYNANGVTLTDPLNGASFSTVVTNVTSFLFNYVAIPLCVIMVLVGAFQMMTSAGDPEKFGKGRKTLIYAAIGFAVAIIAGGITTLIQNILGGSGGATTGGASGTTGALPLGS